MTRKELGDLGEAQVAHWLLQRGYTILARKYRSRFGEVDLVARHGEMVCFVEVKTRTNTSVALPREYVDWRKQERLRTTALLYLSTHRMDCPVRFDVAEVYPLEYSDARITYIENAF